MWITKVFEQNEIVFHVTHFHSSAFQNAIRIFASVELQGWLLEVAYLIPTCSKKGRVLTSKSVRDWYHNRIQSSS